MQGECNWKPLFEAGNRRKTLAGKQAIVVPKERAEKGGEVGQWKEA